MSLEIESVQVQPYRLEFDGPYTTARGTIAHRDLVRIAIETSQGLTGVGETASLSLRGGRGADAIVGELTGPASRCLSTAHPPALAQLGIPDDAASAIAGICAECRAAGIGNEALCAIDLALFDLAGKLSGEPVWRLLGVGHPEPVPCNATLVAASPDAVASEAAAWASAGFSSFKVKVGLPDDVEVVRAVRTAVGPEARIRIDANGAWDADTALSRLAVMGGATELELAEQPCSDVFELVRVRQECALRIAADESVVDPETAAAMVRLEAADMATVKLAKVGGITAALAIAKHLPVYASSALDGPIGIAAAAHLAQALRWHGRDAGVAHGLATERLFAEWPGGGARLVGDMLHAPDAPGLGVEIKLSAG